MNQNNQVMKTLLLFSGMIGTVLSGEFCDIVTSSSYDDYPQNGCARQLCGSVSQSVIKYGKFDRFPVCLEFVVNNGTSVSTQSSWTPTWVDTRIAAYPKMDQFSEINWDKNPNGGTPNPFDPSLTQSSGTVMSARPAIRAFTTGKDAAGNTDVVASPVSIPYYNENTNIVVFYYTILIHVDNGVPTEITFEYGDCSGCDNDKCVKNLAGEGTTCGYEMGTCQDADDKKCQPKTYVAWTGTDRKGIVLTSSGSMLTRFSKYSLKKVYSSLSDVNI